MSVASLQEHFAKLSDPRRREVTYPLMNIVVIAVCAVICGADDFVATVEENTLCGGFGSAVLEAANSLGLDTRHIRCRGLPDRFIEHGERGELLADLGLDTAGLARTARTLVSRNELQEA